MQLPISVITKISRDVNTLSKAIGTPGLTWEQNAELMSLLETYQKEFKVEDFFDRHPSLKIYQRNLIQIKG